jgi:hypothetical protein
MGKMPGFLDFKGDGTVKICAFNFVHKFSMSKNKLRMKTMGHKMILDNKKSSFVLELTL